MAQSVVVLAEHSGYAYCTRLNAGHLYVIAGRRRIANARRATIAGVNPGPVAIDHAGDVLIGDTEASGVERVRLIAEQTGTAFGQHITKCDIYQIAGDGRSQDNGVLASAAAVTPAGIRIDPAGNLLIADGTRVRVVAARSGDYYGQRMVAGHIYSIAGTRTSGYSGDHGPAGEARLWDVLAIGIAPGHRIVIIDGHRIREITG